MDSRIFLLSLFAFAVLLMAGCTQVRENVNLGCCVAATDSENNTICGERIGGDPAGVVDIISTNGCDPTNGVCNIHYRSTIVTISTTYPIQMSSTQAAAGCTLSNSGMKMVCVNESDGEIPICSDRTTGCLAQNCYAQVCGPMSYHPTPIPSLADSVTFTSEAQRTGNVPRGAQAVGGAGGAENLFNTSCLVLRTDENLTAFLKNSKGSAINILRFGVGTSFEDFDKYRFLFPITDSYCNINPFIKGTKDRFMNYMLTPQEFEQKEGGQADFDNAANGTPNSLPFQLPWQKVQAEDFCPADINSSYLGPLFSGTDNPNYQFNKIELYGQHQSIIFDSIGNVVGFQKTPDTYSDFSAVQLDKKFYANFLQMVYDNELSRGLGSVGGSPVPAPFECQNGMECSSGFCDQTDYSRGLCRRGNVWVQCSCTAEARTCYGGTQLMQYPDNAKPTTAAKLSEYVNDYLQKNTEFYIRQEGDLTVNLATVNPACDWGDVDGVGGINDLVKGCHYTTEKVSLPGVVWPLLEGPKITCPKMQKKDIYRVDCAPVSASQFTCASPLLSLNNTPWACANSSGVQVMSCSSSGPFSVSDCTNYGGTSIACAAKSVTCSLSNSDASNNAYDATCTVSHGKTSYMSLTSCKYYDTSPRTTLACTQVGSAQFNDCVSGSDSSFNNESGQPTVPAGHVLCSKNPNISANDWNGFVSGVDSFRFPQDIQFFGTLEPSGTPGVSYVGYTILPESEFAKSDFYTACNLQKDTDYDVWNTLRMQKGWGNSEAVSAFYGGTVFRPPKLPGTDEFASGGYLPLGEVPLIIGSQRIISGGECNVLSDNTQELYFYAPTFIYIKIKQNADGSMAIGDCDADATTGLPITKSFGWCAACSYLTMAEQKIDSGKPYPPQGNLLRTYKDYFGTMNYTIYTDEEMEYNGLVNESLYPALTKIDNYLKEGVMPVFDLSDPGLWVHDGISRFLTPNPGGPVKLNIGLPRGNGPALYILGEMRDDYDLQVVDITLTPRFNPDTNVYTLATKVDDGSGTVSYGQLFFYNPVPQCCKYDPQQDKFCPLDADTHRCAAYCACQTDEDCNPNTCDPDEDWHISTYMCSGGNCIPRYIGKGVQKVSLSGPVASFDPPGSSIPEIFAPAKSGISISLAPNGPSGPPAAGGVTLEPTSSTIGSSCADYDPVNAWPVNTSMGGTHASIQGGYVLDFSGSGVTPATTHSPAVAKINIIATKGGTEAGSMGVCVTDQPVEFQMTLYGQGADATHAAMEAFLDTFAAREDFIRNSYAYGVSPQPSNEVFVTPNCAPSKCIVGFRLLNDMASKRGDERLAQNLLTMKELGTMDWAHPYTVTFNQTVQFVDYSFYPWDFTTNNPGICSASSDLNSELFTRLESLPQAALAQQKLSLIDRFSVETSHSMCWNDTKRISFLSYLFAKQKALSTEGLLGIIYSDVDRFNGSLSSATDTSGNPAQYAKNSKEYCGLQQGSRWYTSDMPVTVYSKIYTSKTMCEQCQDTDVALGTCTIKCPNNVDCEIPTDSTGAPQQGAFKCPGNSVPEPCKPCNQSTDVLSCKFYRSDGSEDSSTFNISDLSDLSPDIIASIPSPSDDVCCLTDGGGNYTYIKQTTAGKNTAPMVFSLSGDPNQDCGVADMSSLSVQMCGASTPIKDYKVECSLYDPSTGILTTKRGRWYIRDFPWTQNLIQTLNLGDFVAGGGFALPGPGPIINPGGG